MHYTKKDLDRQNKFDCVTALENRETNLSRQKYYDVIEDDLQCKGLCWCCGESKKLVSHGTCSDCIREFPIKK